MKVVGPLFYICIIIFVLTARSDVVNGTKLSLNTYKPSRVHHIPQLEELVMHLKQFYLEIEILTGHFLSSICSLYLTELKATLKCSDDVNIWIRLWSDGSRFQAFEINKNYFRSMKLLFLATYSLILNC